jgi:hypothetical protein
MYGKLILDAGQASGVDRNGPATELPVLGTGSVTALTAAGADAWLTGNPIFGVQWAGVWVKLKSAAGADLGTFRVAQVDAQGRALLAAAGGVSGAATYRGEYRFDEVVTRHGAGLLAHDPVSGSEVVFQGDSPVTGEINATNVTVKDGAVVRPQGTALLRFVVSGKLTVETGGRIDATGTGYAGGSLPGTIAPGLAPTGITASQPDAGGSHGGTGSRGNYQGSGGVPGAIFDSVYLPLLGGGGGGVDSWGAPRRGGNGGGVVDLQIGELVLDGEILARGESRTDSGAGGAGGSVSVHADLLHGAGLIDASGGDHHSSWLDGAGGGGRVALYVGDATGFDPLAQVRAWGGSRTNDSGPVLGYAAPGTILVRTGSQVYGKLILDAGQASGVDRNGPATELPVLGTGTVTTLTAAGADAWLTGNPALGVHWVGVWVSLKSAAGVDLGTFRVAQVDAQGHALLAGAGGVSGAATYRGEYRFDEVVTRHGAGLLAHDPVSGSEVVFQGDSPVTGEINATNVTVKSGAVVRPQGTSLLRFVVAGKLTVETGGRIDATGTGYAGGSLPGTIAPGLAPAGVAASQPDAGGSHGGTGIGGNHQNGGVYGGVPGAIYGSVYEPLLGGGGGGVDSWGAPRRGGNGGGVVDLQVGELALDGQILARGESRTDSGAGGAGGSVLVHAGLLHGAGLIDASGGDHRSSWLDGGGGGGRVAIYATQIDGFDPLAQVRAWGGSRANDSGPVLGYAAPGTILVKTGSQAYGALILDAGQASGTDRNGPQTELPALGAGAIAGLETAGADAWLTGAAAFGRPWAGAWVSLQDAAGAELGLFRVRQVDAQGRALLAEAGTVAGAGGAVSYRGEYRFDAVEVRHGAGLVTHDPLTGTEISFRNDAPVTGEIHATNAAVRNAAVLRPRGTALLRLVVSGKLTVESGGRIDATATGFAGGEKAGTSAPGLAPAGVTASQPDAGGSYGGTGIGGNYQNGGVYGGAPGAVFGSVYAPLLGGGGGGVDTWGDGRRGGNGGGVVDLQVGELVLDGEIRSRGESRTDAGAGGAGGSVLVHAGLLHGAGLIDASGGDHRSTWYDGAGGGGRVALYVGDATGFDPLAQVRAWGGLRASDVGPVLGYAAPGTILVKTGSQTYGKLILDAGQDGATDRNGPATELPLLGTGTVTAVTVVGNDARVTGNPVFGGSWTGAWMALKNAAGTALGTFQVIEVDAQGRALLAGAGAVPGGIGGAATYRGEYRFDEVATRHGAGLIAHDPVAGVSEAVFQGDSPVSGDVAAVNVTVKAGAVVRPQSGSTLRFRVSGRLTVETGGRIDVSAAGYAGGAAPSSAAPGTAPAGIAASQPDAGGSYGGAGSAGNQSGAPGAVYGSVFTPLLGGGGGAVETWGTGRHGGAGGGVVDLEAAELVLDGEIRARGESRTTDAGAGGAGGSVLVHTGLLRGAGMVDASGGDHRTSYQDGGGGGGRVAIYATQVDGFDPRLQIKAQGGSRSSDTGPVLAYGAPGTVLFWQTGLTDGRLIVDSGEASGVDRIGVPTRLPSLGSGAVASVTADAAGTADAWVAASAPFGVQWTRAWMVLANAAGTELGAFRVAELDGSGRARLEGAAALAGATGATWRGEYRFDSVELKNGAGLAAADRLVVAGSLETDGPARLPNRVAAGQVTVKSGSVTTLAEGGTLQLAVSGTMTVENGGRLDLTGLGYLGGAAPSSSAPGTAPAGVGVSLPDAGGSHGGPGGTGNQSGAAGEVFGNVYIPLLGGGGGGVETWGPTRHGGNGGGTLDLQVHDLALEGEIRARGESRTDDAGAGGAGGSILLRADIVRGAGSIDASGGDHRTGYVDGGGGGGRVALRVGQYQGFDPLLQVRARGGVRADSTGPVLGYGGAGTVYVQNAGAALGKLIVDQGGAGALTVPKTPLPGIGLGTVGAVTADTADPTALWIEPQEPAKLFGWTVTGMWVRSNGADYQVIGESSDRRRLLLAGAAGHIAVGDAFRGVHKLDTVHVRRGARLTFGADLAEIASTFVDTDSTLEYADGNAPALVLTQPSATTFTAGDTITIAATASDDRGVRDVTFRFNGRTFVDTQAPYQWTVVAPSVAAAASFEIRADAADTTGNVQTVTRSVQVQVLAATAPPTISLPCPTAGVLLAPGTGIDLHFLAADDRALEKVEIFLGTDPAPLATLTAAPYDYRFTAPASALDGQTLSVRAVASDYSRQSAQTTLSIGIVQGSVITADRTLAANDTSLDNQSVVVAGGTLTLLGAHPLRDLVVLDGAKVTQAETAAAAEGRVDLTLQRDLYVACGGAIDVSARGYLGATNNGLRAYGYPNTQAEGALGNAGGSHGGRGGSFDATSPVYGSFFDPAVSGAGGGYAGAKGRDGGGVIRVTALGNAIVDGSVLANGETGSGGGGGAGGSIRINGAAVRGAGMIHADGSAGGGGAAGGGAGGRIALYAASFDAGLLSRTIAAGGKTTSSDASLWGAAGTVFTKLDSRPFGELILDNAGTASTQVTELLPVGSGIVDAVGTASFTDNEADFRYSLGAAEVAFNGNYNTLYAVTGHSHHGTVLNLAVPAPPLSATVHAGDTYNGIYRFDRLVVRGGAKALARDHVTSTNAAEVAAGSTWSEAYAPALQITAPNAGATYTSGASIAISADAQDLLGVRDVEFRLNGQTSVDTAAPYAWSVLAPSVTQGTDFPVTVIATDLSGNKLTATRTVHVDPIVDPNAPVVTLTGCVIDGDAVAAGAAVSIPFTATDDQQIQSYSLVVDGQTVQTVSVAQPSVTATLSWTPPANAAPGTAFVVRVEAKDFGNSVGYQAMTLKIPATTVRTGTQTLTSAVNGQAVFLGAGTFTVQGPIAPSSLILLSGARLVAPASQAIALTVAGELRVQCGAAVDGNGLGYLGGKAASPNGGAPAGITGAGPDAGGSHGGAGSPWNLAAGPPGPVYDSVYSPWQAGGGGALDNDNSGDGLAGGGIVDIVAGQVVVSGEIRAHGLDDGDLGQAAGAGGSVRIRAAALLGKGLIDASGGLARSCTGSRDVGAGGGGRVALLVDQLGTFNPVSQVKVWGGTFYDCSSNVLRYAGPGTVYVKQPASTWGRLIVDSGEETNGADRVGPSTELPGLGSGTVATFTASGADAWVSASAAFKAVWLGAWMTLLDGSGGELGTYPVLEIDGAGRVRLGGASGITGAATWRGDYRFDKVELWHGAGLIVRDRPIVTDLQTDGAARLFGNYEASTMTVKAGAVVTAPEGEKIRLNVAGRLTIEAGARLDVTGLGYAGGKAGSPNGGAPAGITGAGPDAGGSHGGPGAPWNASSGPAGPTFDSVYVPWQSGGGGALDDDNSGDGQAGGGIIEVIAGELVLNGEIRARGFDDSDAGRTAGAGGTVWIDAGTLSGTGLIDASGGYARSCTVSRDTGAGGGGRVSLWADQITGFNPVSQVRVWGGSFYDCSSNVWRYAGPGTTYVRDAVATWGKLIVDNGEEASGADRVGPSTELPRLGTGAVSAVEVAGADLWVSTASGFKAQWLGAGMVLLDAAGAEIGTYPVARLDAAGRALLPGASGAAAAAAWRGDYRFDKVELWRGSGLIVRDRPIVGDLQTDGLARLFGNYEATTMTVKTGSVVTAPEGERIHLNVADRLTIETNARLDVTGIGYAGGKAGAATGGAPQGVAGAGLDAGGSHGGFGLPWNLSNNTVGAVFDSVYLPFLSGGGGGLDDDNSGDGQAGGGVIEITAGELVLNGEIRARGMDDSDLGRTAGAGGSVWIDAGLLSGSGLIDASGGYARSCTVSRDTGAGGGGRVALWADDVTGFNPVSQVRAWGGTFYDCSWNIQRYAGPGTVFVRNAAATAGKLVVDSGEEVNGADRVGPSTELPTLGTGTVTAAEVAGADLWVSAATAFKSQWLGAWMALLDAAGADLGTYPVLALDAQGRARLGGGSSVSGAAATGTARYRGEYHFDRVELWHGAGLVVRDRPVVGSLQTDGLARLFGNYETGTMTVKAGSVVTAPEGERIRLSVSDRLTIEAGARLDVTGIGYAGGKVSAPTGGAPAGFTGAGLDSGGSHGGFGSPWNPSNNTVGAVFDSVYLPFQSGGGGGLDDDNSGDGQAGGGIIEITAGEVLLNGEIRARGMDDSDAGRTAGGGGTVWIDTGVLSGSGLIDASGGYARSCTVSRDTGAAGGGRVALWADQITGFNPVSQVRVWGGTFYDCSWNVLRYAGPGTVFVRDAAATAGKLVIDSGEEANGADRVGPSTELPVLDTGAVTAVEAAGADLWVSAAAGFKAPWLGAWMGLLDGNGAVLGSYPVAALDVAGRARLVGAAAAAGVASYRGEYHFDRVELWHGAGLVVRDRPVVGELQTDGAARLFGTYVAGAVTLKTGSVVTVPEGDRLRLQLSGRLTLETGSRLDVTGIGYAGGKSSAPAGLAPANVTGSGPDAGGSHGGPGSPWNLASGPPGEVFDSIYSPAMAGGGGGLDDDNSGDGLKGGGVVEITAAEVVLNGEIRAKGSDGDDLGRAAGAGGTVWIDTDLMSGAGLIDASGGKARSCTGSRDVGAGGGGRVALYVDQLSGFDPLTQVKTLGGTFLDCSSNPLRYAGTGSVFWKTLATANGKLMVDQGGTGGRAVPNTPLPSIGTGTIGVTAVDSADAAALWIEPADANAKFALGAVGMWVRVAGTDYRVIAQSADRRRVLLGGGAATVTTGAAYRGVYKLDEVVVRGGAKLEFRDTNQVTTWTVDSSSQVIQNVTP